MNHVIDSTRSDLRGEIGSGANDVALSGHGFSASIGAFVNLSAVAID